MLTVWNDLSIRYKILSIAMVSVLGIGTILSYSFVTTVEVNERLNTISSVQFPVILQTNEVLQYIEGISETIILATTDIDRLDDAEIMYEDANLGFDKLIELDPSLATHVDAFRSQLEVYFKACTVFARGINGGAFDMASDEGYSRAGKVGKLLNELKVGLEEFQQSNQTSFVDNLEDTGSATQNMLNTSLLVGSIVTFVLLTIALVIANNLASQVSVVGKSLFALSEGRADVVNRLRTKGADEIGTLVKTFNNFLEIFASNNVKFDEALQIRIALEQAASNVMLLNTKNTVIFLNASFLSSFEENESELKEARPNFSLQNLIGSDIDQLVDSTFDFRDVTEVSVRTEVLGARTYKLNMAPVINKEGEPLGVVVEWDDLTEQLLEEKREREQAGFLAEQEKEAADQLKHIANENYRVRQALDNVATSTMILDIGNTIIYINDSAAQLMLKTQSSIQQSIPEFNADDLLFSSFESVFSGLLEKINININEVTELPIGDRTFKITASGIVANGHKIGTVLEWLDRTDQLSIEEEIDQMVRAAMEGEYSKTINEEGKSGFFLRLSQGFNRMLGTVDSGINDVLRVLTAMSQGDLSKTIEAEYKGSFLELKNLSNDTVSKIQSVMNEIGDLVSAGNEGDFSAQIALQGKTGFFKTLSENLNELVKTTEDGLTDIQRVLAAISKGDLSQKIEANYKGEFLELKNLSNESVSKIQEVMEEIGSLVSAGNEGDFRSQIDLNGKTGFFRTLSENLNVLVKTTDAGLTDIQRVLAAMSVGDLSQSIEANYKGSFLELKTLSNDTVSKMQGVMSEIGDLVSAGNQGDFSSQIKLDGKVGFFKTLSENLNTLVKTTEGGLTDIQRVLAAISKGDLSQKIEANYKGEFLELKNLSNETVVKIQTVMDEIGALVSAGNEGDFSSQIDLEEKTGFFRTLSENLNVLVKTTDAGLTDIQRVLAAMSVGDLSQSIEANYRGSFLELKTLSNDTVSKMQGVMSEIGDLVSAGNQGDFGSQIELDGKVGFFKTLSENLNELVNTTEGGLMDIQRVLAAISKGDLSQKIEANYKGEFLELKNLSNETVVKIQTVMDEIGALVSAGNEGDFSSQIDLEGKTGFFRTLSENLNVLVKTTDAGLTDIQRVLAAMAGGDLSQSIKANYKGSFLELKNVSNDTVSKMQGVMSEIGDLVSAGNQGDFRAQITLDGKVGFFKDLSENLNILVRTTDAGLNDIQRVLAAISKGDLSQSIEADYRGSFLELKNLSNDTVVKIQTVMDEIGSLVLAGNEGNFSSQINLKGKTGFFKILSEDLNVLVKTTDAGLTNVHRVLSAVATGDLTDQILDDYDGAFNLLKNDVNTTVTELTDVIGNLRRSSVSLTAGAKEIVNGTEQLRVQAEMQSKSLEKTTLSLGEMTELVLDSSNKTEDASLKAKNVTQEAIAGGKVIAKAVIAMEEIQEASNSILNIISVIDDIAFQTNLLALNAAVEAARAGEEGRGFAVVAAEVRNLAQRSAESAKEIKSLISNSVEKVNYGSRLVDQSGVTLNSLVESIVNVSELMESINVMCNEQRSSIENINSEIRQIEDFSHQSASVLKVAATSSGLMAGQTEEMQRKMGFFHLNGG
ncbi:MAG: hypothetical protein JKX83_06845 [Pseudomonadales bacterium]|nr:hypothetical protein [Pseudomonadales bacterium]